MLALAEYWNDLGHVLSFICLSSFLMESSDFVMLVSKETVYVFPFSVGPSVFREFFGLAALFHVLVVFLVSRFKLWCWRACSECQIRCCTGCPARLYQVYLLVFLVFPKDLYLSLPLTPTVWGIVVVLRCLLTLSMVFDNGLCGLQQDRQFRFCANLFSCYLLRTVICGRMVEEILSTIPIKLLVDDAS